MNMFYNDTEMLVFILLAIPFIGVVITALIILYSDAFVQKHVALVSKMFNSKSTKIGRMAVALIFAVIANLNHWLMVETLFIAYIGYHLGMLFFFRNKIAPNLSLRKY
jgi:hypothetical protein